MRTLRGIAIAALCVLPIAARAGGLEILEQSPTGVAMAGAGAAKADGADAVFYNPAGMAFQHGLAILGGATIARTDVDVTGAGGSKEHGSDLSALPTVFVTQRLGAHFGVGIGVFTNFASAIRYAPSFGGRFLGTAGYISTLTINPSVAIRPIPRVGIGIGLDVIPVLVRLSRTLSFGGDTGGLEVGGNGMALGANVGVLVQVVKRYLDLGITYRSVADADVEGKANVALPVPLASRASARQDVSLNITLPHNLTFALASRPVRGLSLAADAHLTLWNDLESFDLRLDDPAKPAGSNSVTFKTPLDFKTAWGVRVGAEYWFCAEHLALRLGVGYDKTPIPARTLAPLFPDGNRVMVGAGVGLRAMGIGLDVGYQAIIVLPRDATNYDYPARYETLAHLVGIALTIRAPEVGGRLNDPDYKR